MTNDEMLKELRKLHRPYLPNYVDTELPKYGGLCYHCSIDIAENSLAVCHPCPTLLAVDPEAQAYAPQFWRNFSRFSNEPKYVLLEDFKEELRQRYAHFKRIRGEQS